MKTNDKMAINLTRILNDCPLVSFKGSSMASMMTAALCTSLELLLATAICTPLTRPRQQSSYYFWSKEESNDQMSKDNRGNIEKIVNLTNTPGANISFKEA